MKRPVMPLGHFQGFFAVGGLEHGVPVFFENLAGQAAHAVFVFGNEDRLSSAKGERRRVHRREDSSKLYAHERSVNRIGGCGSSAEHRERLDVRGHREQIEDLEGVEHERAIGQFPRVAGERGDVA